jgi:hypothetical protein
MKAFSGTVLKSAFIASVLSIILGALLKIMHYPNAEFLILIAFFSSIIFVVAALTEIHNSIEIDISEKIKWTIGLILMTTIVGLAYLIFARKRIIKTV